MADTDKELCHSVHTQPSPVANPPDWLGNLGIAPYRRVFVSGASGFVGGYLRQALSIICPEAEFVFSSRQKRQPGSKRERWINADLADTAAVSAIIAELQPDLVIHLAAQASGGARGVAAESWETNVGGAITLAKAVALHSPDATLLNVSSSEVYGYSFLNGTVNEDAPLLPVGVYGRTKAAAESVFTDILPDQTRLITARSFNHTGPGQDERFVIPAIAAQIARIENGKQKTPLLVGNLSAKRDFLDVRDVVRAYAGLIVNAERLPVKSIYNISSGFPRKISCSLDYLLEISLCSIDIEQDKSRLRCSEIQCSVGNAQSIYNAIGWKAQNDWNKTLSDVLNAMRYNSI